MALEVDGDGVEETEEEDVVVGAAAAIDGSWGVYRRHGVCNIVDRKENKIERRD